MSDLFVMRRANGDLFTQEKDGERLVPVWSTEEALARYKERNPELMIYFPARLTRSLIDKTRRGADQGKTEFFRLDEDDPDADLDDGKPITLDEILSGVEQTSQPAPIQV